MGPTPCRWEHGAAVVCAIFPWMIGKTVRKNGTAGSDAISLESPEASVSRH
jgi:hypothetical protein